MRRWMMMLPLLAATAGSALAQSGRIPERSEIDPRYQWRLEDIYASVEAWEADFSKLEGMIPEIESYQDRVVKDGKTLLAFLQLQDRITDLSGRLTVFAGMRHHEDTRVDLYASLEERISGLQVKVNQALSFFEPALLELEPKTLKTMVSRTPGLELYDHYLESVVRGRPHVLTADMEGLLAAAGDVTGNFSSIFSAFHNADVSYGTMLDSDGNEVELTKGRYRRFQESPDRRVREESWKLFYRAYETYGRTLAANMAGTVKSHVFYARARNYETALEASLDPNAIPVEVYRNLIDTVTGNIEPLHRYVALRKRILGVDTLEVWDMAAPLIGDSSRTIEFDEAVGIVTDGLAPLGDRYLGPFAAAFTDGWVDVYETQGKRGGAYSWGSYGTKPYLLLNYNRTLDSVFTLGHEMGHSMHSYFSWENQPIIYGDYSTFVAEVASTTNEALMIEKMLAETPERGERLVLLNHYLEQIRGTFFTQVMFADFELAVHEMVEAGVPLTKEALNAKYLETYAKYFGPEIRQDPLNGSTWSRIPHFHYNFYVYQYATSYAAATALSRKILAEGKPAVDAYLDFLKAGSSDYPIEVLKRAGVDMTQPGPILDTITTFSRVLEEMETLLAGDE